MFIKQSKIIYYNKEKSIYVRDKENCLRIKKMYQSVSMRCKKDVCLRLTIWQVARDGTERGHPGW